MATSIFSFPAATYYFERMWTLDGTTYMLTMRYNLRIATWFMDVADATGVAILSGVPLLTGRDLLAQYVAEPLPQGLMLVYDNSGDGADPEQDSFQTTHSLIYFGAA